MLGQLNMNSFNVTGLGTPTLTSDATSKTYVDTADATKLSLDGSLTMTGDLNMGTNNITNVVNPVNA
jgi:hypothetical protein